MRLEEMVDLGGGRVATVREMLYRDYLQFVADMEKGKATPEYFRAMLKKATSMPAGFEFDDLSLSEFGMLWEAYEKLCPLAGSVAAGPLRALLTGQSGLNQQTLQPDEPHAQ